MPREARPQAVRIEAPSRLHFGLLARGEQAPRRHGGLGLMIESPGFELALAPRPGGWSCEGPDSGRVLAAIRDIAARLEAAGFPALPAHVEVARSPRPHSGLGTGTQLHLALAEGLIALGGHPLPPAEVLGRLAGRGLRSGIGLHGYRHGGLILDGGRGPGTEVPPLLGSWPFPPGWSILLVLPDLPPGLHGAAEVEAFAALPPIPEAVTNELCALVLLRLLPAVLEGDLGRFGEALERMQLRVGETFRPVQSGWLAHPELEPIVAAMRSAGLRGVGQSSWGPALYGFTDRPEGDLAGLSGRLAREAGLDPAALTWTRAAAAGRRLRVVTDGRI